MDERRFRRQWIASLLLTAGMTMVAGVAVSFFAFLMVLAPRKSVEGSLLISSFIALFLGTASWKVLDLLREACPQVSTKGFVPARWTLKDVWNRTKFIPWSRVEEVAVVQHRLGPWWIVFRLQDGSRRRVTIQTGIPDTFPVATLEFARKQGVQVVEEESTWTELGDVPARVPDLPLGEVGPMAMDVGIFEKRLLLHLIVAVTIVCSLAVALGYWLAKAISPAPPSERNWLLELFMVELVYFISVGNLGMIAAGLFLTAARPSVSASGLVPDRWKVSDVLRRRRLIAWSEMERVVLHWVKTDDWIMYVYLRSGGERRIWKKDGIPNRFPLVVRHYARSHGVPVSE